MTLVLAVMVFCKPFAQTASASNPTVVKKGPRYDTIIRKHVDKPVVKAKPATAKGKYVKKVNLASTMSPGVLLDEAAFAK